jgi:hypothetical protein
MVDACSSVKDKEGLGRCLIRGGVLKFALKDSEKPSKATARTLHLQAKIWNRNLLIWSRCANHSVAMFDGLYTKYDQSLKQWIAI